MNIPSTRLARLAELASLACPAALSAACAGASMGFYDAPELASCAAWLGVTHPPGHPLWVALASLATLIPVGDVPFRCALMSGVCLSLLGWMAYQISLRITLSLSDSSALAPLFALSASLSATLGPAVLRQASRAEVYALAGALALTQLYLSTQLERPAPERARLSVFILALGGANHHFIALTALPLTVLTLASALRSRSFVERRNMLISWGIMGLAGLFPYALLPLRANGPGSLVRVNTPGDFVWTVTARVFQKNTGVGVPGRGFEHLIDVLEWIGASLSPVGLVASLGGVFVAARAMRDPTERPAAEVVFKALTLTVVVCAARAFLGFVRGNPDAAGYLMPAIASVAVTSAAFLAGAYRAVRNAPEYPEGPTKSARWALMVLLVLLPSLAPLYLAAMSVRESAQDRAFAPERITDALLNPLPQRAVLLLYSPESVFRTRYAQLVEGARPDVTAVEVPFVPWPGMTTAMLVRDGALLPLVRDYLAHGAPRIDNLAVLASLRPLRVELDPHNLNMLVPWLLPRGLSGELRAEPTTLAAVRATSAGHFSALESLAQSLGECPGGSVKFREYLLWRSYNDAVFFAARGARPEARRSLRAALVISPESPELLGLSQSLEGVGEGPVDIRPFMVGGTRY